MPIDETTDVLIVGSGPAGVSAAFPLVEAGFRVTMVDAGRGVPTSGPTRPPLSHLRRGAPGKERYFLGDDLRMLREDRHPSPKLRAAAPIEFTKQFDSFHRPATKDFTLVGTLDSGGLSSVWGAVVSGFDDEDLSGMPIGHAELAPSYRAVAGRIGVSGANADDVSVFHGAGLPLQPPIPIGELAQELLNRYSAWATKQPSQAGRLRLGLSRNAVLSKPLGDRNACTLDNMCMWSCARGAVYQSLQDVLALSGQGNFIYAPGTLVRNVQSDGDAYLVEGSRTDIGAPCRYKARIVLLAAGTIGSTRLVAGLMKWQGRKFRLLNNPAIAFALLLPHRLGSALPDKGFGMSQLTFVAPSEHSYATGSLYAADGLPASELIDQLPFSHVGGRRVVAQLTSALILGLGYFPGEFSDNHLWVEHGTEGERIRVEGRRTPQFGSALKALRRQLHRAFLQMGAILLPGSMKVLPQGGDSHYAGTLPMGELLTQDCELIGRPNLFVVDGACFGRLPAKHLTFSVMANADRVGRQIAARYSPAAPRPVV
jgi:choline dehydrogenase-like flavoprotein